MSELAFNNKGLRTPNIYEKVIHPTMKSKLGLDKKEEDEGSAEAEQVEANFLAEQFNLIKSIVLGEKNATGTSFEKVLDDAVLQELRAYQVFDYIGVAGSSRMATNAGTAFEEDIARIIFPLIKDSKELKNNLDNYFESVLTGRKTSGGQLRLTEKQFLQLSQTGKEIDTKLRDQFKKVTTGKRSYYVLAERSIKTDFSLDKKYVLDYKFNGNADLVKFFSLLSGSTFSAKNYLLSSIAKWGVSLGHAKEARSISSSLAFVGYDSRERGSLYGRTINYRNNNSSGYERIEKHLDHLKFAYELMGIGQGYGAEAKFLIVNTRTASGSDIVWETLTTEEIKAERIKAAKGDILVYSNRWLIKQVYNNIANILNDKKNLVLSNIKSV